MQDSDTRSLTIPGRQILMNACDLFVQVCPHAAVSTAFLLARLRLEGEMNYLHCLEAAVLKSLQHADLSARSIAS